MINQVSREEQQTYLPVPLNGMNTKDPPHRLPQGFGIDLYNVVIDEVIGISKRSGFTTYNSASAVIPRVNTGTIKEITGAMVYGSGCTWSGVLSGESLFMFGNSSAIFWRIDGVVNSNTMSLAIPYTQTVTNSSYVIGVKEVGSASNFKYGTTQKLIAFAGNDMYTSTAGLTGSFTRTNAALTAYARVQSITFQDKLWFCNGYEFKKYDGSTVAAVGGTPTISDPKYIGLYTIGNANFLGIAGSNTDAYKSAFSFSDVNAPETWPAENIYYAGDRDGTVITGIKPIPGGWAIFKEGSIYVFSGLPSSGTLRKVVDDIGCVAPESLVAHEGVCYFVGRRGGLLGLFAFDGSPNITYLSLSIEPTLDALKQTDCTKIVGNIFNDKYYISGISTSGTYNDTHFICYIRRPTQGTSGTYFPCVRGNRSMNYIFNYDYAGDQYMFSLSPTNGFVYREENGTADDITDNLNSTTAAITSYVDSAWMDFGDLSRKKELLKAYLDANESGNWFMNFQIYRDFQSFGYDTYQQNMGSTILTWADVQYGITPWQDAVDKFVHEVFINYPTFARYFKFRWTNNVLNQYFTIYPMTLYWRLENR